MKTWQEIPIGGTIIEAGNSEKYLTGGWRAFRPHIDFEKCTQCFTCWLYCPDISILVDGEKVTGVKLEHCKGCGLCANVCPAKCIEMIEESSFVSMTSWDRVEE